MPARRASELEHSIGLLLPVGQDVLRAAIRSRGMTIAEFAADVGVSRKHLSNVLNGRVPLLDPLRDRLCRALDLEPELLVCLLDDGGRAEPAPHGAMNGAIVRHGDLTEPGEDWEMLEN